MPRRRTIWGLNPSQPLTPPTAQIFRVCPSIPWNGDPAGYVCRLSIPVQRAEAVVAIGKRSLLLPAWIKVALAANDCLRLFLSAVQTAAAYTAYPDPQMLDLASGIDVAQSDAAWLRDMPVTTIQVNSALRLLDLQRFTKWAAEELDVMACSVLEAHDNAFRERVQSWFAWLGRIDAGELTNAQLRTLINGVTAGGGDSLHQLVMDPHKQLAELGRSLAVEKIGGTHVWQVLPEDRTCIAAFMRGLNRTTSLKFGHTDLGTAVMRDGDKLSLQDDTGATDVHVLMVQMQATTIMANYADLHRRRFEFFRSMSKPLDVHWEELQSRLNPALNGGQPFVLGTVRLECGDETSLDDTLEGISSRIAFLIDQSRVRKRLLSFAEKDATVGILQEAAHIDAGHMAWFKCGDEALIHDVMRAIGTGIFHTGDRLDTVLGAIDTCRLLINALRLASQVMLNDQPAAQLASRTRLLPMCSVRLHDSEFELFEGYAAYCHALAQSVNDALEHNVMNTSCMQLNSGAGANVTQRLAARAKPWKREADELVTFAREKTQRQPRWGRFAYVIGSSDDTADVPEEAAFLMSLIADGHQIGRSGTICNALCRLARTAQVVTQEHTKALAIAHDLAGYNDMSDSDTFVAVTWNVLCAERQYDELLRQIRHLILVSTKNAVSLVLANDLAWVLELTSDWLLVASYMLRGAMLSQAGQV